MIPKKTLFCFFSRYGGPGGIRTLDQLVKSEMLYH
jgi:hypothetical protein